ncbi:MAG: hypothetical protein ACRDHE_14215, partial [Ktedonobacterales bacterium]
TQRRRLIPPAARWLPARNDLCSHAVSPVRAPRLYHSRRRIHYCTAHARSLGIGGRSAHEGTGEYIRA